MLGQCVDAHVEIGYGSFACIARAFIDIMAAMKSHTVLVLAGGEPASLDLPIPSADYVIAADSGFHQAQRLRVAVDLIVGDMDSISPAALPSRSS